MLWAYKIYSCCVDMLHTVLVQDMQWNACTYVHFVNINANKIRTMNWLSRYTTSVVAINNYFADRLSKRFGVIRHTEKELIFNTLDRNYYDSNIIFVLYVLHPIP